MEKTLSGEAKQLLKEFNYLVQKSKAKGLTDMDIKDVISVLHDIYVKPITKAAITDMLSNPPDTVLDELLDYYRGFNGFENITKNQVKTGIVQFLLYEADFDSMDVQAIANGGWEKHLLTDTDPRDAILGIIEKYMKKGG